MAEKNEDTKPAPAKKAARKLIITRSELEDMPKEKRQEFRDAQGTVTEDPKE